MNDVIKRFLRETERVILRFSCVSSHCCVSFVLSLGKEAVSFVGSVRSSLTPQSSSSFAYHFIEFNLCCCCRFGSCLWYQFSSAKRAKLYMLLVAKLLDTRISSQIKVERFLRRKKTFSLKLCASFPRLWQRTHLPIYSFVESYSEALDC